MSEIKTHRIGKSEAVVTKLGLGGAPLGDLFEIVTEEDAQSILRTAWEAGIRYFDTAPFYGYGKSEHRVGHFLRQQVRSEFIVSTKVGRVLKATRDPENFEKGLWSGALPFHVVFDYSYNGIVRSYEDSLQRLSLNSIDVLLVHDLDFKFHQTEPKVNAYLTELSTSGWRALDELRSSGVIKGIGAGI